MNYKEAVERKIVEKDESTQCKELWEEIAKAYEQGGEDRIKSVLIKHADKITSEFEELLDQLRKKL